MHLHICTDTQLQVTAFAGLPPHSYSYDPETSSFQPSECTQDASTRADAFYADSLAAGDVQILRDFYAPHNAALFELLGSDLGWPVH